MPIMNTDSIVIAHPEVNAASAYLASLSSKTSKATMCSRLNVIARLMGAADASSVNWATLNAAHVVAIVGKLSGSSSSTKNQTLAALKGVARAAWRLGQMTTDDYERIRDVRSARSSRELAGRDVERDELAMILKTCKRDDAPAGARDAAMFALSASCGLRRCELACLSMSDIRRDDDDVELRFVGKGDKERTAYCFNGALKALKVWLAIRGSSPGALFPTIDKAGQIHVEHHMSTVAIHKRFTLRCEQAGVDDVHLHDLRRTWIGAMLDSGADIVTVATLAGHSDVRTTQRYDRRPSAIRRAAACKVQVPY